LAKPYILKATMLKPLLPLIVLMIASYGQTPALTFEVATVKPASQMTPEMIVSGKMRIGMRIDGGRVEFGFLSLRDLIQLAYDVKPFQVSGPDWMTAQRFDVVAKLPDGATKEQVPQMLQALLAERFKLAGRRESKEMPIYALIVAKGGPKFKESPPDSETPPPAAKPEGGFVVGAGDQQLVVKQSGAGTVAVSGGRDGAMRMTMGAGGTMRMEMVTPMLDRPVVDHTGLNGKYQIALELAMQDMMQVARAAGVGPAGLSPRPATDGAVPAASDPSGGSIFNSVQQLGLRLEKEKASLDTIVVEHLEKNPTDN
jgi:uncharacterized protein (TIGR03435 family)